MYVTRQLRSALSSKDVGRQVKDLRRQLDSKDRETSTAACKRIADILTEGDSSIRLEFTLLAAALTKCSQMPSGPQQHRMLNAMSEAMIQRLNEDSGQAKSQGISPKRIAETLRVIAVIGRSAPEAVVKLRGVLRPRLLPAIPDMAALQLRHVAWAINRLSLPWHEEVRSAVSTLLDRIGVAAVGSEELATFVWAVSRMGCCTPQLAAIVAIDWAGRINQPSVSSEAHAMVLSSLGATAKTQIDVIQLFDACSAKLDLSSFNTSTLASLLWAFGHVTSCPLNPRVWKTCLAAFTKDTVGDCPLASLGNACWAAGTTFQTTRSDLPLVFVRHICDLIASSDLGPFPSSGISSIVWAAGLANDSGPWVRAVFNHLLRNDNFPIEKERISSQWKPLELATVIASVADANLAQAFPNFIDVAKESIAETVHVWPPTSQNALAVSQLSKALWSSGEAVILPMVEWALTNGQVLTPQSESRILWAAAKMFEASALREQPVCIVAFIDRIYQRCCERQADEYSQQDVALMAWSLGTLRLSHYDLEDKCCLLCINMLFNNIIDSRHLSMLLWGIISNNSLASSNASIQLIKQVVHRIENGTFRPLPADASLVIWSLAVADQYSDKALRQLLQALFTEGAATNPAAPHTEKGASLIRLHRALLWARVCHGFVPNSDEESKLMAVAKAQKAPGGGVLNSSNLQLEIRTQLQSIVSSEAPTSSLRDEYELPPPLEGIFVDLAVIGPDGQVQLVVEVDGYSHFSQVIGSTGKLHSLQYNGATELSRRILRKAGYRVLSVSTVDWNNTQRHERGQFLTRLFREPYLMALTTTSTLWQHARTCTTAAVTSTGQGLAAMSDPFKLRKILLDASRQKKKSDLLAACRRSLVLSSTSANSSPMKLQLLTTSLHRLVKHFYNTHSDLVDSHCEELSKALGSSTEISINNIADVLWSVGMVGAGPPSRARLLALIRPSVLDLLARASPSQLSNVVCAIAKLDLGWSEEIRESMAQCRVRLGIEATPAGVISNVCWAAARMGCRDDAFLNDLAETWLSRDAKSVPASATALVFWSLGKLAPDASYVTDLFSKARSHEGLFSGFGLRECTSTLCGYAYSGEVVPSDELFKVALASVEAEGQGHVTTQTIANCCWASATLVKHHGDQIFAPASCLTRTLTMTLVKAGIRGFSPQEASNVIWASAQLLDANKVALVASSLLPVNQKQLTSYAPQDIAVCLAALTQAGVIGTFENSFVLLAMQKVKQTIHTWPSDSTHIYAVGQLAWSMAGRPFQDISPLLQWASSRDISSETFVKLLWSTASTPEAQRGSLVTPPELLDLLDKRPEGCLNQQELALTLWSLATLRLSHRQLEERCATEARELLLCSASSISSGHLSMVMWGLASNSHRSPAAHELLQEVIGQVNSRRYRFTAADSHHVAWSLAAFEIFDPTVLDVLLSSAASTVQLDNTALQKIGQLALWASSHGFQPSQMVADLLKRASVAAKAEATVTDSIFQKQLAACLNEAVGSMNAYRVSPELDLAPFGCPGVIVDLAVLRDSGARQGGEVELIVEADGPSHYVNVVVDKEVHEQVLDGKTVMRRTALRRLGFRVEDISISQWKSMSRSDRQELVNCMIKKHLGHRGGKPPELNGRF